MDCSCTAYAQSWLSQGVLQQRCLLSISRAAAAVSAPEGLLAVLTGVRHQRELQLHLISHIRAAGEG
jgi:hypothetical protein